MSEAKNTEFRLGYVRAAKVGFWVIFLLTVFSTESVTSTKAQQFNREEMLVCTSPTPVVITGTFNPLVPGYMAGASYYNLGILEPLYVYDVTSDILVPWLADEQPRWLDNNTVEVKLKEGVYWQDGTLFTAEDVEYTWELPRKGIFSATYQQIGTLWSSQSLSDIEVVDNTTVHIVFNQDKSLALKALLRPALANNLGPILPKHIFEQAEQEYDSLVEFTFDQPIGTGPYKLHSWDSQRVIAERWDDWWGKDYFGRLPEPKYYVFVVSSSNEEAMRKIIAGDADTSGINTPRYRELRQLYGIVTWQTDPPFMCPSVNIIDGLGFNLPRMNQRFGKENSRAIRLAIGYAIDREAIVKAATFETGIAIYDVSMIPKDSPLAFLRDENLLANNTWSYDLGRARKILDDADIVDYDGDGIRELPDQTTDVTLAAYTVEGFTDCMVLNELLQAYCEEIGIKVDTNFLDFPAYINLMVQGIDYDVFAVARHNDIRGGYYELLALYDNRAFSWVLMFAGIPGNSMGYVSEELNSRRDLVGTYYDMTDPLVNVEVKKIASEIQQILLEDIPVIPVWGWRYAMVGSTKYWIGWPSEDNPYQVFHPAMQLDGLITLINIRSVSGPPPIPEEIEETIESTFAVVSALESKISELETSVSSLVTAVNLQYVNIALTVVLIIIMAYVAVKIKHMIPED